MQQLASLQLAKTSQPAPLTSRLLAGKHVRAYRTGLGSLMKANLGRMRMTTVSTRVYLATNQFPDLNFF